MIREVTYFQAVCDVCGKVDDGGDYSAWSDNVRILQPNIREALE